jgi:site-specific recombinase XerD
MSESVTVPGKALAKRELERAFSEARRYAKNSRAKSTWRAYENDWAQFEAWCQTVALGPLPAEPDTVAMFVASQAANGLSPSTITRRLAAIRLVHLGANHPSPHNTIQVMEVMRGIRREWAKPPEKKAPAIDEEIKLMADAVESGTAKGLRDRALLLFGFAGAFRRSELVGLDTWNLEERDEGLKVTIEQSKTDQEAQGQVIAILRQPDSPYCPVQALKDWLTVAEIERGALFRRMYRSDKVGKNRLSAQSVAMVIKDYAHKAGLDSSRYSGHSLRSGFLTSAARNRASIFKMADQSRHRSLDVLRQYVKDEDLFENNAGQGLL